MSNLTKKIKNLPDSPGVYLFKDGYGEVLYIGKATSLYDRVRSYFVNDIEFVRSPLIAKMVTEATEVVYEQTDSVLEALILEANLIKKYQPIYNTREKDNKSFNYVVITNEEFPRVLTIRGKELTNLKTYQLTNFTAGPFPYGKELQEALKIIRKLFPFHDGRSKSSYGSRFYRQLGLSPETDNEEAQKEYKKTIKNIILFFEGNKKKIIKNLEKEMKFLAKKREFEKAEEIKRKIFALNHIQDVALIKNKNMSTEDGDGIRIESYDIAHMAGKDVVGVMTVVIDGIAEKNEYRKFIIKQNPGVDDTGALREILSRRFKHVEWGMPNLVAVDGSIAQISVAMQVLEEFRLKIPVVAVTKNDKHKPDRIQGDGEIIKKYKNEILLGNSEAHRYAIAFHRQKRGKFV